LNRPRLLSRGRFNIGYLYNRQGNQDEALNWYKQAAGEGNYKAMNNLGFLYEEMKNEDEAGVWYKQAIELGDVRSLINIFCLNGVEEAKLLKYAEKFNELVKTDNIELIKYKKSYSERYEKALKNAEGIVSKKRKRCDDEDSDNELHDHKRVK